MPVGPAQLIRKGEPLTGGDGGSLNRGAEAWNDFYNTVYQTGHDIRQQHFINRQIRLVKLTKWTVFDASSPGGANANRWHYDGTIISIGSDDAAADKTDPELTFAYDNSKSDFGNYLLNITEINNTNADGVQGNSITNLDPTGATVTYQPVGGDESSAIVNEVVVMVFPHEGADGRRRYVFQYQNAIKVVCD
jgi:hypothetical protein